MEAKIVNKESFTIMGYSFKANLKEIVEQELCKKETQRLKDNQSLVSGKLGDEMYLIQLYDMKPNFNPNVDPFTQIIGYKVSDVASVPVGMVSHTVPDNKYVTVTHKGLESELYKSYDYVYGKWLAENSYHPVGYDFDVWDERYKPEELDNEIDVFVALK